MALQGTRSGGERGSARSAGEARGERARTILRLDDVLIQRVKAEGRHRLAPTAGVNGHLRRLADGEQAGRQQEETGGS